MVSPQAYLQLAKGFFQRNNPIETLAMNAVQTFYNIITFNSRRKILQYRRLLEVQKLQRLETTLNQFNPYEHVGSRMNRRY
jgi:hypothetical protein